MKKVFFGLFIILIAVSTGFAKKPVVIADDPILIVQGTAIVDGDLSEWSTGESTCFPLHWAGQKKKEILSTVCLRYDADAGILYVKGEPTDNNVINWKSDSVHMKLNKVKLWDDDDFGNTNGVMPEYMVVNLHQNDGGFDVIDAYEASAYVGVGDFSMVAHISIFPDGDYVTASGGQSSRTLRGIDIRICTASCPD